MPDVVMAATLILLSPVFESKILDFAALHGATTYLYLALYAGSVIVGFNSIHYAFGAAESAFLLSLGVSDRFLWIESYLRQAITMTTAIWATAVVAVWNPQGLSGRAILLAVLMIVGYLAGRLTAVAKSTGRPAAYGVAGVLFLSALCCLGWIFWGAVFFPLAMWMGMYHEYRHFSEFLQSRYSREHGSVSASVHSSAFPLLKKELSLVAGKRRALPVAVIFCIIIFMNMLLLHTPPTVRWPVMNVESIVWLLTLHDAWTLNAIGLEGDNLRIYASIPHGWTKLVVAKLLLIFSIIGVIGVVPSVTWYVVLGLRNVTIGMFIVHLFLFHVGITIMMLSMGTRFAKLTGESYYRVHFTGLVAYAVVFLGYAFVYFFYAQVMLLPIVISFVPLILSLRQNNLERLCRD